VIKYAIDAKDAAMCQQRFMMAHGIICTDKKTQKRKSWSLEDSSARGFGTIEDLIYMWHNMDMTLPETSYRQASLAPPKQHHPLPYLPESLRVKLYPLLQSNDQQTKQMSRYLGAVPPHPVFHVKLRGRPVELSATIKVQTQNYRRVGIEIWRKHLDETEPVKERLKADDMKNKVVRDIVEWIQRELRPAYMKPQEALAPSPEENLRGTSIRAHEMDYAQHHSDPGPYKMYKTISGTITRGSLISLFEQAKMGPSTVFLDIGSGLGEPMITAATGFQVQLSLGLEVHKSRVEESVRSIIEKGVSRAFPVHVGVEEICRFDPVTHVYCYTNGIDIWARNCIRESILSSKSVEYVMTDRKNMLRYNKNDDSFEQVGQVKMGMAFQKGKRTFYVLKRKPQVVKAKASQTELVRFHPIFALPLYTLRFNREQEQAFLIKYLEMLEKTDYQPLYFRSMKVLTECQSLETTRIKSEPMGMELICKAVGVLRQSKRRFWKIEEDMTIDNCFYSSIQQGR